MERSIYRFRLTEESKEELKKFLEKVTLPIRISEDLEIVNIEIDEDEDVVKLEVETLPEESDDPQNILYYLIPIFGDFFELL